MRARKRQVESGSPSDVPEFLRVGACMEVWTPERTSAAGSKRHWTCRSRYIAAKERWLQEQGIKSRGGVNDHSLVPEALRGGTLPWSFEFLARTAPDLLAARLDFYGLKPDWTPQPAPPEWRATPTIPDRPGGHS